MTAKRVTIGAKPTLVQRETPESGQDAVPGAPSDAGPSNASPASIEDWLRNGETSADEKAPAPDEASVVPIAAAVAASEPAQVSAKAPAREPEAVPPPAGRAGKKGSSELPPWLGIAGGAVAGAAIAAIAAILMPRLMPVTDARLAPLAERVTNVEVSLRGAGEKLGRLNNEMAQSLDDQASTDTKLAEQATEIGALKQAVTDNTQQAEAPIGIDSPVFSVALGQLRTTFYTGRPFEAELMNVYAIAGNNDLFSGYLTQLMGPARTGIPNAAELQRVFPSYVTAAGLNIGAPAGYYQYSMSLVNRYVISTEPYKLEAANLAVTRADRMLAVGDVAGAVGALQDMDAHYVVTMTPWLDAARNYLRNETAITEMTRIVVDRLRERIAKELPAADIADPLPTEPSGEPATLPPAATPEAAIEPAPAVVPVIATPVEMAPAAASEPMPAATEATVDLSAPVPPSAVPNGAAPEGTTP